LDIENSKELQEKAIKYKLHMFSSFYNLKHMFKNKKPFDLSKGFEVVGDGIEPPTRGFSVLCSTD
tara:strand:+ start:112 stop:306 length:195 start_codon:yes stop_codon:yes gene_type:complete